MTNDWLESCTWIEEALQRHQTYRRQTLNLIASENIMSDDVARYYSLELGHRYGNYEGLNVRDRKYTGNRYLMDLEERALAEACSLFHAGVADLRALSGHVAGSAAIMGLCDSGDLVLELDRVAGGHRLASKLGDARIIQLRVESVPFDGAAFQVNIEATIKKIKTRRPRLVILGSSNYLFPTPLKDIANACAQTQTTLLMDASHILGLIAGGQFPQPLDDGANLIIASTHKTFCGPQGGIILGKTDADVQRMLPALYPGLVTNHHLMRIPAVIALLSEWRAYGQQYARTMVANAIALADALEELGIPTVRTAQGATKSQTILLKVTDSKQAVTRLEDVGILTGAVELPAEHGGAGIRLGVQEVTRMGLQSDQIDELAKIICDALEYPTNKKLPSRVQAFGATLQEMHFCHSHE